MKITRTSPFTGKPITMELPITDEQLARWEAGEHIEVVFSHLTDDEHEFLITGITSEEWKATFGEDE